MFLPSIKTKIVSILLVISLALLVLSIVLFCIFPNIIRNEVSKNVQLVEGTEQYDRFVELPFPLSFKVYLFNVENPLEISEGKQPLVREVGPYVYKEYSRKTINSTDDVEDTISYTQKKSFVFDSEASGALSEEDSVTILNVPMMSVLQTAEQIGQAGLIFNCMHEIFGSMNTLFVKVQVKDLLFDGMKFCVHHFSLCSLRQTVACKMAESRKNIDKLGDGSLQFSFFNYKVKADDGLYTVKRGVQDVQSLGHIIKWNNLTYTNFWDRLSSNNSCDQVGGTDSTIYPPHVSKDSVFEVFSTDICRTISTKFLKETTYKDIKGYMFAIDNRTFYSSFNNKDEDCYCAKETQGPNGEDVCYLDGVIDIGSCLGAPVLLSFPHFLWADRTYIDRVSGLSPNETLHMSFVTLEPETGIPLQGASRFQINAVLRPIQHIKETDKLPGVVLPLVWIEEGVSLPDKYVDELNEMYFEKVRIIDICKWFLLGISLILTVIFGTYFLYIRFATKISIEE